MRRDDPRLTQGALGALVCVVVFGSVQAGLRPAIQAYYRTRSEIVSGRAEISRLEALVRPAGGMAQWREQETERLKRLKARFPDQARLPIVLNALIDTVKRSDLRLVDVAQGNLEPVKVNAQPVRIDGRPCYRLPVTVIVDGRYHAVVRALDRLVSESFPGAVGVQAAKFHLKEQGLGQLEVTLRLSVYVVEASPTSSSDV